MKFGTDLDGVIVAGTGKHMIENFNEKYNRNYTHSRDLTRNYWFTDLYPELTEDELWKSLIDCDYDNLGVYDGSVENLKKISNDADIIVITNRCLEAPNIYTRTLNHLYKNEIPFDLMLLTKDKGKATELLELDYMVEDAPHHALECADAGAKTFLMDYPYNRDVEHENIIRVRDWDEIYEKFTTQM